MTSESASPRPVYSARGRQVKLAASGLLALMVSLYFFSRSYEHQWPWLAWVRAFAEAGMVGGLADWFAVTALFRHPLGLPIPHTAIIPKGKDRIGSALASFVRGNFLTADRICSQVRELKLLERIVGWLARPEKAREVAARLSSSLPELLDSLEKYDVHQRISIKLIKQLRELVPADLVEKLITWLLKNQRCRHVLAPLLAQIASALDAQKEHIESAAGRQAPLKEIPLLGRLSRTLAENFSERTVGNIASKLNRASEDCTDPLWEWVEVQLVNLREKVLHDQAVREQFHTLVYDWLDDVETGSLAENLWQQIRASIEADVSDHESTTEKNIIKVILATAHAIQNDTSVTLKIEMVLIDALGKVLDKHGTQIEAMIRDTVEQWDPDTMMHKLENQVGPDLQYIRINGTLFGGMIGLALHALGTWLW